MTHAAQHPVELLGVDAVRALDRAVQARRRRLDLDVLDALVEDLPGELGLELRTVVGLDPQDLERELLEDVVDELDRDLLVEPVVEPQDPQARAVVDRGELRSASVASPCAGR